jgi:hypothetical protein
MVAVLTPPAGRDLKVSLLGSRRQEPRRRVRAAREQRPVRRHAVALCEPQGFEAAVTESERRRKIQAWFVIIVSPQYIFGGAPLPRIQLRGDRTDLGGLGPDVSPTTSKRQPERRSVAGAAAADMANICRIEYR